MLQEQQGRVIGPVRVVEDDQRGAGPGTRSRSSRSTASKSRNRSSAVPGPASSGSSREQVGREPRRVRRQPVLPRQGRRSMSSPTARRTCRHGQYGGPRPAPRVPRRTTAARPPPPAPLPAVSSRSPAARGRGRGAAGRRAPTRGTPRGRRAHVLGLKKRHPRPGNSLPARRADHRLCGRTFGSVVRVAGGSILHPSRGQPAVPGAPILRLAGQPPARDSRAARRACVAGPCTARGAVPYPPGPCFPRGRRSSRCRSRSTTPSSVRGTRPRPRPSWPRSWVSRRPPVRSLPGRPGSTTRSRSTSGDRAPPPAALRFPGQRARVRPDLRPHPRPRPGFWADPCHQEAGRDQHHTTAAGACTGRPGRPRPRDHHPPVRRPIGARSST